MTRHNVRRALAARIAGAAALVAAVPAISSAFLGKLDVSGVFDAPGETIIASAPDAVESFYCTVFSPDMRKVAYAARVYQGVHPKEAVYLNDEPGPMFDFVNCEQKLKDGGLHVFRSGVNSLTFSGDGSSFAYQARNAKQKWKLVLDGKEHAGIQGSFHFAPGAGTIAAANCLGQEGCCWRTGEDVVNPKEKDETCPAQVEFPEGLSGKPVHVYYEFSGEGLKRVAIDGEAGPWFKEVRDLRISPDGKHHSYVGCASKDRCTAVLDGVALGVEYQRILSVVPGQAAGTATLIAKTDKGFVVNHGGVEGPVYQYVTPPPVLDGKGNAFTLATQGEEKFAIVRQGAGKTATTGSYPCIHLMAGEPPAKLSATYPFVPETPVMLSPDGERFAFLACCNTCCKPTEAGPCKKAGCLSDGADFQMKVVINKSTPSGISKGTSSKCLPPGSIQGFTWSPDGGKFAYAVNSGKSGSILVNNKPVVTRAGETFSAPTFTPDGSEVVFVSSSGKKEAKTARLMKGQEPVSKTYDHIELPFRLSLDGKRAAFNAVSGRTFLLVVVDLVD